MSKTAITALLEALTLLVILATLIAYLTGFLSGIQTSGQPIKPDRHPPVKKPVNHFSRRSLSQVIIGGINHARPSRLFKSPS